VTQSNPHGKEMSVTSGITFHGLREFAFCLVGKRKRTRLTVWREILLFLYCITFSKKIILLIEI
jgi:hypothetical protein